jgi:peptidoglycan/xylan/chitin deacetylase (PgdA/CDA1 family)
MTKQGLYWTILANGVALTTAFALFSTPTFGDEPLDGPAYGLVGSQNLLLREMRLPPEDKTPLVALRIDGLCAEVTPLLLDILKEEQAVATFSYTQRQADPGLLDLIHAAGHELLPASTPDWRTASDGLRPGSILAVVSDGRAPADLRSAIARIRKLGYRVATVSEVSRHRARPFTL